MIEESDVKSDGSVVAVDLGASSGRVLVGRFGAGHAFLDEVHRFPNTPTVNHHLLTWDAGQLRAGVLDGLRRAIALQPHVTSIGVDSWAVDYGLLDSAGSLIDDPIHYRDPRTNSVVAEALGIMSPAELYSATGAQLQPFNTLFQLLADAATARLERASHALLIPDLVAYWLTGEMATEVTNASTTALLDPRTRQWSSAVQARLSPAVDLFPPVSEPGAMLGPCQSHAALGSRLDVVTVASHDTASAVVGVPSTSEGFAYVCTGTWSLVGVELPEPIFTPAAREANFTNELGLDGTVRFLRNVTGFWLAQEYMRECAALGEPHDIGKLTEQAGDVPELRFLIDVQDPAFTTPGPMRRRIADASASTTGAAPESPAEVIRCLLDSMAVAIRQALREAVELTGHSVQVVHVVGGGAANKLFCQLVADSCELPVLAGPVEAASWGNAMVQARTLGLIDGSLSDMRALLSRAVAPARFEPRRAGRAWANADSLIRHSRQRASSREQDRPGGYPSQHAASSERSERV
jgi:rhamnulokinase